MAYNSFEPTAGLLSNYYKGSFTPVLGATTTDGLVTYTTQLGRYVKLGSSHVWICLNIVWSAWSGSSGSLIIRGLPFTSYNLNSVSPPMAFRVSAFTMAGGGDTTLDFFVDHNDTTISVRSTQSGGTANAITAGEAAGTITLAGIYEI